MKGKLWPILLFFLVGCNNLTTSGNFTGDDNLFTLKDVTITGNDGSSFTYRGVASSAFGDQLLITMQDIVFLGQNKDSSYTLKVKHGRLKASDLSGELKDGLTLSFEGGYTVSTEKAYFTKESVISHDEVIFKGPSITLHLDGASLNTVSQQIESLGPGDGLFSPPAL